MGSIRLICVGVSASVLGVGAVSGQGLDLVLTDSFAIQAAAYDALPSGQIFGLTAAGEVLLETGVGSGGFAVSNTIAASSISPFGASFVSVSPDGSRIAVGNGEFGPANAVDIYDASAFVFGGPTAVAPEASIVSPNFAGDWSDDSQRLFVTGGDATSFTTVVNQIDLSDAAIPPTAETVITPAGFASGGVAATGGDLFVGDGGSGSVFLFDRASLDAGSPADLATGGLVATENSAAAVDVFGDLLFVAGQEFMGDGDFVVIDRVTNESVKLSPAGTDFFYGGFFNTATNQMFVTATNFATGERQAFVYDIIPTPGVLAIAPLAGLVAARRRRA
ncbi:MAG: hypothetical protein AAGF47_04530 [Planctomycetota bacterium]